MGTIEGYRLNWAWRFLTAVVAYEFCITSARNAYKLHRIVAAAVFCNKTREAAEMSVGWNSSSISVSVMSWGAPGGESFDGFVVWLNRYARGVHMRLHRQYDSPKKS